MSDEKKIQETIDLVGQIIEARVSTTRKKKILEMLEGDYGVLYFTAPASSRDAYHYNWPGGLAQHSINVYKNLRKLNEAFDQKFTKTVLNCLRICAKRCVCKHVPK